MANDYELGMKVHAMLLERGLETPMRERSLDEPTGEQLANELEVDFGHALYTLGLDMNDDSLLETPKRIAKMWCKEIFSGLDYQNFPKCTTVENKFGSEMVLERNIVVRSTCEHHLQPIYGKAHIAYIPNKSVLGLSKFSRVLDFFACRPQVQERLTEQVSAALQYILGTDSVAVVIEADHFCMRMRGVKDSCATTTTSKMSGKFFTEQSARIEVLQLMKGLSNG